MKDDASEVVVSKGPCPKCGSKDNCVTYADGHQHCYSPSCGPIRKADPMFSEEQEDVMPTFGSEGSSTGNQVAFTTEHMPNGLTSRNISKETASKFGYFIHKKGGRTNQICPIYSQSGSMVLQKYRGADKKFFFKDIVEDAPRPLDCKLIGQQVYGDKFDRKVVITEGEMDMMSVYEACKGKMPAVSILQGVQSAKKCLQTNYRWLDRFEEIILWFDNDEQGQAVIAECADLFKPGKVKTVRVPGIKDASDLKQKGKDGEIYAAVWGATSYTPDGIINAANCVSDMEQEAATVVAEYPFKQLQEKTMGMLAGDVIYHVAGTGVGKTSIIVEYQNALLKQGVKFGVMRFEDLRQKSQMDLMSRHVERRLHLEKTTPTYRAELHTEVFSGGLVELFDPEKADWSLESVFGYIRYMNKALGCKVVFVDPLSFVVAMSSESDERKALDKVAVDFAQLVKQTGLNLQITHHLNRGMGKAFEEGGEISLNNIRGSAGIAMFSMGVFGYERNQQGQRPDLMRIRLLKNRFVGTTGLADTLKWDETRGVLEVTNEAYPTDDEGSEFGPVNNTEGDY